MNRHSPTSSDSSPAGVSIGPGIVVSEATLRWAFSRSSGPGGQNVNKLSTKAELRVDIEALPIAGRVKSRVRALGGRRVINVEQFQDELGYTHDRGGELILTSESERSQTGNKDQCLTKLRELLVEALVEPKKRRKTKPTRGSKERRLDSKKKRGDIKRGRREQE